MSSETAVFTTITAVHVEQQLTACDTAYCNPTFDVRFETDGEVPFAQVVVWAEGRSIIAPGRRVANCQAHQYSATIPEGAFHARTLTLQVEGCRVADLAQARAEDWIKFFIDVQIVEPVAPTTARAISRGTDASQKIYFGIHKHMHQPYYRAADPSYWNGEIDDIFGTRAGAYSQYLADAIRRYVAAGLPHAGLSTSFSGSLIEQLHRCHREGLSCGRFRNWSDDLRRMAALRTTEGNPRLDFTAFGFFHPLMPLLPHRDIVRSIRTHRSVIRDTFGTDPSPVMFPPETAFHERMIPALIEAGVSAVIYDSIHRFRTCKDYPYGGPNEGMLPPNPAEQTNAPATDWLRLQNVWAASPISPALLRPSWIGYEDPDGVLHRLVGVPAERYLGNEDARGGFGALQYPSVFGQLFDSLTIHNAFDPKHPPFFILHSDGDNYGGGADSYYRHNTDNLVQWLNADPRFELTTIRDYLDRFPPDPNETVHIEPGSWSGADNGDPQFSKWFSRAQSSYSPDINSWAVLTMLQNAVHSLEDLQLVSPNWERALVLLMRAETSCYWYWTGQDIWDAQVTDAANAAYALITAELGRAISGDTTPPTIFPPWLIPANPGGQTWGDQGLKPASPIGVLNTLIADITGIRSVEVVLRHGRTESVLVMQDQGPYPSRTQPCHTAHLFQCQLPQGLGTVRYYIRAVDMRGNVSRSSLERAHLA